MAAAVGGELVSAGPCFPRVEQFIIVSERRGEGVDRDPVRLVTRVYTLAGEFVAEWDAWARENDRAGR